MVVSLKGEAVWQEVCERAGVAADGFIAMCPYHDDMTFKLVAAASEVLQLPQEQVLQAFGEYWILYTADEGYAELMEVGGETLRAFLGSLDDMHGRVETIFSQMRVPRFSVHDLPDGGYDLHYQSERKGLAPMVVGLVRGLAKRFGETVTVQHVADRGAGGPVDIFRIHVEATAPT